MSRATSLIFSIAAYAVFFATFLYLIAFVGNFPIAGLTIDHGPQSPTGVAIVIDLVLISLFGLQHSVMARQGFKKAWTRIVPEYLERSIYVLGASLALIVLFLFWRPIPAIVWDATMTPLEDLLWIVFALGWLIVLLSTFLINHFELFGLQQAWLHVRNRRAQSPQLRSPFFYRWVAHPLYSGFLLAFWATPVMTAGHLLFALAMTVYILTAIRYEERDLRGLFGPAYDEYRAGVGMLTPKFRGRST